MVSEAQALGIFGKQRFLAADRVTAAWNRIIEERRTAHAIPPLKPAGAPTVRYHEATLKKATEDSDWYLIYDPGFSLRENRAILGNNPDRLPGHLHDNDWWLAAREDGWANTKAEPGYYLIRMEGMFPCDNPARDWDWQEEQVRQMGDLFQRAPTYFIANGCISCFLLNNQEAHLEKYCHFGPEMDADYCFVATSFENNCLNLGHWLRNDWGGYWGYGLKVCLVRKFDF